MKLSQDQVAQRLRERPGWLVVEELAIQRQFTFDGFPSAIAFVVRVGFEAEAADHHPDILISGYRKVTVTFSTHSAGGITEKDFAGARQADALFARWGAGS